MGEAISCGDGREKFLPACVDGRAKTAADAEENVDRLQRELNSAREDLSDLMAPARERVTIA